MTRLALLGLSHEVNTFTPTHVDRGQLATEILRGEEIIARHAQANTAIAGLLTARAFAGVDVVPFLFASFTAAGPLTAHTLDSFAAELSRHCGETGPGMACFLRSMEPRWPST